jgi:hypothetical protein
LSDIQIDSAAPGLVNEEMAKKHVLIPIAIENNQIVLVMNDTAGLYCHRRDPLYDR